MKQSQQSTKSTQPIHTNKAQEQGRIIAQAMAAQKAQAQKNMIKAEKRHNTMLERAAERALSGK